MATSDTQSLFAEVIMHPERSQTMAASVATRLRDLIIRGQLPAGTPLALAPLAHHLQVSVMPIREALRSLESEGLVILNPRRGAVVSEPSLEEAEEVYTVRVALEALCARHAAERLTDEDITDLHRCFEAMSDAAVTGYTPAFVERDHDFHLRLYRISGREQLLKSIEDLMSRSLRYVPYLHRVREMQENPIEAHHPLMAAIELRDPELIEALTRIHEQRAMDRLLAAIRHSIQERGARAARIHHGSPSSQPKLITDSHAIERRSEPSDAVLASSHDHMTLEGDVHQIAQQSTAVYPQT